MNTTTIGKETSVPATTSEQDRSVPQRSGSALDAASPTRLDREYGFTYRTVLFARRYRALLDEKLRPLGYGTARMEALSTIARAPEPSAQIAIAKRIGIEGPTLTRMLDALESEGLVLRRADPNDRRTKLIELTDDGRLALDAIMAVAHDFRASVLAGLSDDELDMVNAVTGKLLGSLCDRQGP